jgi:hypothetical protein
LEGLNDRSPQLPLFWGINPRIKIAVAGDRTILPVGAGSRELFSSSPYLLNHD